MFGTFQKEYVELVLAALLPVVFAGVLYVADKKTPFGKLSYTVKQIVYGVIFGAIAVLGTEFGIPINGAQINCRDAAVLTSGLLFGGPAGIIAGFIGGIERFIAVAWGVGSYTRIACSISTVIAGFYAAVLRKYMFENKRPGWIISLAIGTVMEVFHMTMIFITNMGTPEKAMLVVKSCTVFMVPANAISVMLAAIVVTLLSKEKLFSKRENIRISKTIQRSLIITVLVAFLVTSVFVFQLQTRISEEQTESLLDLAIEETSDDISDASENDTLKEQINFITKNRHIGKTGYTVVFDEKGKAVSAPSVLKISDIEKDFSDIKKFESKKTFLHTVNKEKCFCKCATVEGYSVVSVLPKAEAQKMRNVVVYVNSFMEVLVFAVLFAFIYVIIKNVVVNRIKQVNKSLAQISNGNLDEVVNVRSNEEFALLSDDINSTVATLKSYINDANSRLDKELEIARNIQYSVLPNVFPAFPNRKDFDIFAMVKTAKDVGGDFYDFYLVGENKLNFLVADVSGKGVPAAMFMMRAKTELKSLTESGLPLGEVFTRGNAALCSSNDSGIFVTAWQGCLDLETGHVTYVNAGHVSPFVKHADGSFESINGKSDFVLGGMDNMKYTQQEFDLASGDVIYLYTDGVIGAVNSSKEIYSEARLLNTLNSAPAASVREICENVKVSLENFVGQADGNDDIAMLSVGYIGPKPETVITHDRAVIDDIPEVTEIIEGELEKLDCPMKTLVQINIAIDEIYSNIAKFAYKDGNGPVTVKLVELDEPHGIKLTFIDEGMPYNPVIKEDPDVTLSAEERKIGGLGIFMVKKSMNDMQYQYINDQNILVLIKYF